MIIIDTRILFYEEYNDKIRCKVCPHNCILDEEKYGICRVRTMKKNIPTAINYGEITAVGVDPIEKNHYITLNLEEIFYLLEVLVVI